MTRLLTALRAKEAEFHDVIKIGRTHLMVSAALVQLGCAVDNPGRGVNGYLCCVSILVGLCAAQDATPLRLGDEFSAFAQQVENGIERLKVCERGDNPHRGHHSDNPTALV